MAVGISALLDFSGVSSSKYHLASTWELILGEAITIGKMTKIAMSSHQFAHIQDEENEDCNVLGGATAFALLSESHISVHTWPELKKVVVDVFTCGSSDNLTSLINFLIHRVVHTNLTVTQVQRGDTPE
ncbi:MAG: S-adenosylmethionine decarboxylase family protein [Candidatus Thorarchaeota archaeon]